MTKSKEQVLTTAILAFIDEEVSKFRHLKADMFKLNFEALMVGEEDIVKILESSISVSMDNIDIDAPQWTYIAAKIYVMKWNYDLYKDLKDEEMAFNRLIEELYGARINTINDLLLPLIEQNMDNGNYDTSSFHGISNDNIEDILNTSKHDSDYFLNQLTILGAITLRNRYAMKYKDKVVETPELVFLRVVMGLCIKEENKLENAKLFYERISKFKLMSATPTLSNSGKQPHKSQKSSCYVTNTFNSIEGITQTYSDMSILSKNGGGIGGSWGAVGSEGEDVSGAVGACNGKIPYMSTVNSLSISFDQLGVRKGAISTTIDIWDVDTIEWCDLKKNSGEERRRAHDIFPALSVPDIFMRRVKANEDWSMFHASLTVEKLHDTYGEEFEQNYLELEKTDLVKQTINAKVLWKKIIQALFEQAGLFLMFRDTVNRRNPNDHAGMVYSSNLCVTGDTRLATQFGLVTASDLQENYGYLTTTYDKRVDGDKEAYGAGTAKSLPMHLTKQRAEVFEIVTQHGYKIKTTSYHELHTIKDGKVIKSKVQDLKPNDTLLIQSGEGQFGTDGTFEDGIRLGLNQNILNVDLKQVPEEVFKGSRDMVLGYLQAIFNREKDTSSHNIFDSSTPMSSAAESLLLDIQLLLSNFSIVSNISSSECGYATLHSLNINGDYDNELRPKGNVEHNHTTIIKSITPCGIEDVYDTTQDFNHSLIFNGIVSSNCHEILENTFRGNEYVEVIMDNALGSKETFLSDTLVSIIKHGKVIKKKASHLSTDDEMLSGEKVMFSRKFIDDNETAVCNLASINVANITSDEDLRRTVRVGIRMLDNVILTNYYPIKAAKRSADKYHAIGLGVMGENELLANNKIKYNTDEHINFIDELYAKISYYSIEASSDLAVERGTYESYEGSKWSKGILTVDTLPAGTEYYQGLDWDSLREKVKRQGMANGYLNIIPPTSSISTLVGTTPAAEPVYRRKFFEENLLGLIPITAPKINTENWEFYTPSFELDMVRLAEVNSVRQKYLDQGISLNFFVPTDKASGKYINDIYMKAWETGNKTTYYLRSESPEVEEVDSVIDRSIECVGCQ